MPSRDPSADEKPHLPPYGDQTVRDQPFAEPIDREVSRSFNGISYHEEQLGGQSREYTRVLNSTMANGLR